MKKGNKHMDGVNRCGIQSGLDRGDSGSKIAKDIGVSLTTVMREIKKHTYVSFKGCYGRANQCIHRQDCMLTCVCKDCPKKGALCARCIYRNCNKYCENIEYIDCDKRLMRTAQVCNGCPEMSKCHKRKLLYSAEFAQRDYERTWSEHRQGAALEEWEREYIDNMFSPKIRLGQSIHHIYVTNKEKLTRNERTIQRYLNYGLLSVKRGDLKRACCIRPRKSLSKEYQHKVEKGCYKNRTFADYLNFLAANPNVGPVYADLVIGRPGGVCLLTIHWVNAGFMIGILIPNKCAASVIAAFDAIYDELGEEAFMRLFPVIVMDRGTEFSSPSRIEFTKDGKRRTRVFFCDPMNPNQKSQHERNHEIVREILPKGISFDALTQDQAYLALSHVNAYVRGSQGDRTPFEVFEFLYGKGTAAKLHIEHIDPKEVILKPSLIGIEMK